MKTVLRKAETAHIIECLQRGEWCAIIAPPMSGKTELARQLQSHLKQTNPAWCVVGVQFKETGTVEDAWKQVLEAVQEPAVPAHITSQIADELHKLVDSTKGARLCLILDNVDALPDEVLRIIAGEFRKFKNASEYGLAREKFACVLLGAVALHYLVRPPYSPLTNVVVKIELPDLSKAQVAEFAEQHCPDQSFSQEALEALFCETAGHPHLLTKTLEAVQAQGGALTPEIINAAARAWANQTTLETSKQQIAPTADNKPAQRVDEDPCFERAIRYIENDKETFLAILALLEQRTPCVPLGESATVAMCGAVSVEDGRYAFRGRMFERALAHYLDDLRRADYCALHGEWNTACEYYKKVTSEDTLARRRVGFGKTKHRIIDLFLGLTPIHQMAGSLEDAERAATATIWRLFGATAARLWRLEPGGCSPTLVCKEGKLPSKSMNNALKDLVGGAIRSGKAFTLAKNLGIVRGIGGDGARTRWAIEVFYKAGLPGPWVRDNLDHLESQLYSLLTDVRGREVEREQSIGLRKWLHELSLGLQAATKVDEVLGRIVVGVTEILRHECAQICLVFPEERLVRAVKGTGAYEIIGPMTVRLLDGDDVVARVVRTHKAMNIPNCLTPDSHCDETAIMTSGLKSQVIVPILQQDEAIGTLSAGTTRPQNAFTDSDVATLQLLADEASIALKMANEREALELALKATGDATVVFDASGKVVSCNADYSQVLKAKPGVPAPLTQVGQGEMTETLSMVAFRRKEALQSFTLIEGQRYIVTAAARVDAFGRYAGGVEVIGTRSPLYGLTEALSAMLECSEEGRLGQAIVDAIRNHLRYSRARFFKADSGGRRLVSRWSAGLAENATRQFEEGLTVYYRDGVDATAAAFVCLDCAQPIVVMPCRNAESEMPRNAIQEDSQHRRVFLVNDEEYDATHACGDPEFAESMEVPLLHQGRVIGKVVVEEKRRPFGLEDLQLMELFAQLAAQAMARVLELEEARAAASVAREVKFLKESRGLEAATWDFILEITSEGPLAFNRAAVFLRKPHTTSYQGALCIGIGQKGKWEKQVRTVNLLSGRRAFIENACRERLEGRISEAEQRTIGAIRELVIDEHGAWAEAIREAKDVGCAPLKGTDQLVQNLCQKLDWDVPQDASMCTLKFQGECEGLLYVDRAFVKTVITNDEQNLLCTLCAHFAAVVHAHRRAEELRGRMLGIAHAGIAPMAGVRATLDGMANLAGDPTLRQQFIIASAEAQRSIDTVRRALRTGQANSSELQIAPEFLNPSQLLRERIRPYLTLLEAEGVRIEKYAGDGPASIRADKELLGLVFAELAANARTALLSYSGPSVTKYLRVESMTDRPSNIFEVRMENSVAPGTHVDEGVFDLFSSTAGTGFGLWLARHILQNHGGTLELANSSSNNCFCIVLRLPLATADKLGRHTNQSEHE